MIIKHKSCKCFLLTLTCILLVIAIGLSACAKPLPTPTPTLTVTPTPTPTPTVTPTPTPTPTLTPTPKLSLTYENNAYGISIKYPQGWTKQEGATETVVQFFAPKESSSTSQAAITIAVKDLSAQSLSLDAYTERVTSQLQQTLTDFNLIESGATTLAGIPAHKVVYTGKQEQRNPKVYQVWTIINNKAYMIKYAADPSKYSEFLGIIQQMIDSFSISTATPTPTPASTQIPIPAPIPTPRLGQIGIGATAYDWFAQKCWIAPTTLWNQIDPVPFLADNGFDWLRVGVTTVSTPELESDPPYSLAWKDEYWCSREYAFQIMRTGAKAGMHLNLFFYLSDGAAFVGNQKAPAQWQNYSLEETAAALKKHTFETTKYYKDKGLKIELYEIGNEIEFGICGYSNDTKLALPGVDVLRNYAKVREGIWVKEAVLLKSAIEGVKQADPDAKIVLHISSSQYPELTEAFFKAMSDFGVPYDYGGLSYYPWTNFHPDIPIPSNCLDLSVQAIARLGKQTVISEFSFPSGKTPATPQQNVPGYDFTLDGQAKWVHDFLTAVENNPYIKSIFYFYPDNYSVDLSSALFVDDKQPKPAISQFKNFRTGAR